MKRKLLLFLVVFALGFSLTSSAQNPPYFNNNTGISSNAFPLNSTTSNKVQWVYDAGMFSGAITGLIDTFWLRTTSTVAGNFTSGFEISMAQNPSYGPWTSGTFLTGLTSVFAPGAYATAAPNANGWVPYPLSTPFFYDPLQPLVVEVKQSGYSPGLQSAQNSANGNRRIWGGYTATTGGFGSGLIDAGMSLSSPLACATPFPLSVANVAQTTADLAWVENNATPATLWNIELVTSGTPPTGIATYPGVTTNPYPVSGLTQNTSYDFYVQADCGPTDSLSYWYGPFTFTTLASCPWPTALTATNITSSAADLGWTENGTATVWDIELIPSGSTPSGTPNIPGQTTNPFSIPTGSLPGLTCWDYYVRAVCGGANGSSQWTGPYTFCTLLAPLSCPTGNPSTVFTETFDVGSAAQPWPGTLGNGWTTTGGTAAPNWEWDFNNTGSGNTGPLGPYAGAGYVFLETSGGALGNTDTLISPPIDLTTSVGNARALFYTHMYGAAMGDLIVIADDGTTQTTLLTITGQQQTASADPWTLQQLSLASYVGSTINLRFVGVRGSSFTSDMAIDELIVEACVACAAPSNLVASNITATSADLTWTDNNMPTATAWDLEVISSGTPPTGIPTHPGVTSNNPYNLTGLTLLNAVDVYVRADCGVNGASTWIGPVTILPCAPLAGTYTIDPALPAGGTNFQSYTAAALALQCGISAPVIFNTNVAGSPYNEAFDIPVVMGSSATNTITWNGNGSTITWNGTPTTFTADRHTMRISGADYMFFNDITFENTHPTYAHAVHLWNETEDVTFTNCVFKVSTTNTGSDVNAFVSCGVNADATTIAGTPSNNNIIIDSCETIGGYYGIYNVGNNVTYGTGWEIKNSTIEDFYFYGNYNFYSGSMLVSNNEVHRPTRINGGFYGIYASTGVASSLFEKNHLHTNFGGLPTATGTSYGFYFFADGTSAATANTIQNNLIEDWKSNGTQYGIYSSTANWLNVWHNTVVLDDAATTSTSLTRGIVQFGTGAQGQNCQNNNVVISRGGAGAKYCIYLQAPAANLTSDGDNLYMASTAGTNNLGYVYSANRLDLAAWQAAGVGANSTDVDPLFVAPATNDYTPANGSMDNIGAPLGVLDDFLMAARSATTPDAGAFEFTVSCPQPNALTATNITSTTADLDWTEVGVATAWEYQVVPTTTPPGPTGTYVTAKPTTATGLMGTTIYDYYVRSVCGVGDTSLWAGPFTFSTLSACDSVTAITVANISATQADISWTEMNSPPATQWEVEVVPAGTAPTGFGTVTTNNPYTAPGLSAASDYDVYVRALCGPASSSFWNGPVMFSTPCAAITAAQFCTEGQFSSGTLPTCWTNTSTDPSTSLNNFWKFTGNPGYGMAGTVDHTNSAANQFAWVDGSSPYTGQTITLTAPPVFNADVVAMTNPMLEYYMKSYSTNGPQNINNTSANFNTFDAEVSYDGGATWVMVVFHNGNTKNQWQRYQAEIDKTALGTNDLMVRFNLTKLSALNSFYNDITLDDVCIKDATCASQFSTGIASTNGTADCECTDINGWTHYGTEVAAELLLSVEKIAANDPMLTPWMVHVQGAATGASDVAATAPYVTSPWWIIMNRFWDVFVDPSDAVRQPSAATDVMFYYNTADYTAVTTAVASATPAPMNPITAHTDLFFYKLDNATVATTDPTAGHSTTTTADYNQYNNGAAASLTDWAYMTFGTDHQSHYEVSSFSGGGGGFGHENGALPVVLLSFTAEKAGSVTNLDWTTSSEFNNSHFNVQKSTNGIDFEQIGKVDSKAPNGNSDIRIDYASVDETPVLGHNYYRLEQVDIDGQKHYSEILDVIWGVNGDLVSIYPNPTSGSLNVDIATEKVSKVEVRVLDMTGRSILVKNATTVIGINNVQMDLGDIAPGVYNVQVYTNGNLTHTDKVKKN